MVLASPPPGIDPGLPFLGFMPSGRPVSYRGDAHLLTVARPGSGKSRAVIIPNLSTYRGSVVVLDPKAELAEQTARWREERLGQKGRVYVFDPFCVVPDDVLPSNGRATFNPLWMIRYSATPLSTAYQIAEALIIPAMHETHWTDKATGWLAALLLYVATSERFPDDLRTLHTVWRIFEDQTISSDALYWMRRSKDIFIATTGAEMAGLNVTSGPGGELIENRAENVKELDTVRSTFRTQLVKTLSESGIHTATAGTGVDFGSLGREPGSVYICLPGKFAVTHARFMRLLISCALSQIEDGGLAPVGPGGSRPPATLFIMDEFATLGKFQIVTEAMGRMRGYGVKFHTVVQTLSQLKNAYGDGWEVIMGNAGVIQYFGGTMDLTTADYLSRLSGETTQVIGSISDTEGPTGQRSRSQNLNQRQVYLPGQIRAWPNGSQVLMLLGAPGPIEALLAKLDHSEFPEFRDYRPEPRPPLMLAAPEPVPPADLPPGGAEAVAEAEPPQEPENVIRLSRPA